MLSLLNKVENEEIVAIKWLTKSLNCIYRKEIKEIGKLTCFRDKIFRPTTKKVKNVYYFKNQLLSNNLLALINCLQLNLLQ